MAAPLHSEFEDALAKAIEKTLKDQLDKIEQQLIKDATFELSTKIHSLVAGISLSVLDYYSIERVGNQLLIRVRLNELKGKDNVPNLPTSDLPRTRF